jgi:hypothetical protein
MRQTLQVLVVVAVMTFPVARPAVARAQSPQQPAVEVPRVELVTGVALKRAMGNARVDRTWMGPDVNVSLARHVTRQVAAAAQVETDFDRSTTVLGGVQLGTDFVYGNGRDRVPGRFIGRVLAGVVSAESGGLHPACQLAAGADILIGRTRGIGVRWEAGYELIAGGPHHANGRLAIGLVFGPHLQRQPRSLVR